MARRLTRDRLLVDRCHEQIAGTAPGIAASRHRSDPPPGPAGHAERLVGVHASCRRTWWAVWVPLGMVAAVLGLAVGTPAATIGIGLFSTV